ncbi:solute carrier family 10 (sodium/bile acid cotransporter), member 7 [Prosthecobacter debontii]|uniref:Solute carrier family 10 (Sodium/bile acid cotransporter), member 7 n=1 Tax=Prosthecobacter debontii TaxID=48467 RepID=A0A1T4YEP1_9BACT|nr:bile acid:sodium symporter family protein [Prosthecobacter debontii]SKB00160.1 solute carrier family 10 (sodium/bile acid cotransporter), member 7 [Prosthecobacter debontii]
MSSLHSAQSPSVPWWRVHGFLIGLVLAVILGFIIPGPGSRHGGLHAEVVSNGGIALILFLQGLSLALEKIKSGAANWRLHVIIQSFTFAVFPVVGLMLNGIVPWLFPDQPQAVRDGFLYLCVLPSTISTSVVLTALAGGNTAGALFNAALSNILGVLVTPILVHLLMQKTGQTGEFGPLLLKITLLTLLPFSLGMLARPHVKSLIEGHKVWITRISNGVILFIVYAAFCESVEQQIWHRFGTTLTLQTGAVVVALFVFMSLLVWGACRALRLNREDSIAAYFCSVKKTLAMGVPLAMLIFGDRADLTLILLPIMFYHPLQLFVNGLLANRLVQR